MPSKAKRHGRSTRGVRADFSRDTDLERKADIREERRSVLIVTNGQRTEVDYFLALRYEDWVNVDKVTVKFQSGDPVAAIKCAAEIKDDSAYDTAWAVCDVDQYDVASAMDDAAKCGVELALSKPCFEVLRAAPGDPLRATD